MIELYHDTIIVGGGASGLLCAIIAHDHGANVAILEKGARVGKKLLTTGNGRCNITNTDIKKPYRHFHSFNEGFYTDVLDALPLEATIDLFSSLGLDLIELEGGKVYPRSLQASSVLDLLRLNIEERGIPVYLSTSVNDIKNNKGFVIDTTNGIFKAHKVVIACGGVCAPETGSDGSLFPVLKKLGHKIINPLPAIVQLKLDFKHLKAISGVRFDSHATLYVNQKAIVHETGEVLFTDYGLSGPAILQLSRYASIALAKKKAVRITIDLFQTLSKEELIDRLENQFGLFPDRTIQHALMGMLHKKLIPVVLKECEIDSIHKPCGQLTYEEKKSLYRLLKEWSFECIDTQNFKNAQTTIGGVDTVDVDSKTLESKIIENLFLIGEVLDVDGDCGGYNLQWAWSSAYVVGRILNR